MNKIIRPLLVVLALAFVAMQFFQPDKNSSGSTENHVLNKEQPPEEIRTILQEACLDCHSNDTRYLWYHKIAPVSWMVNEHIIKGKEELNFSEWGEMDLFDKIGTLEEMCQESTRKTMPLKSYTIMHRKAKLSEEQIELLCNWTNTLAEELLEKSIEK